MALLPLDDAILRFKENEERSDVFVNETGQYTTSGGAGVETLPSFILRKNAELNAKYLVSTPRGAWATTTAYSLNDLVVEAGLVYVATLDHTSADFATDLAAGKLALYQGPVPNNVPGKNYCWNGNFDVWQRRQSFTSFASRNGVADGWTFSRSSFASGATVSQQIGSRIRNLCMRVARNDGDVSTSQLTAIFNLSQEESRDLIAAGTVALSLRARKGVGFSAASLTIQLKHTDAISEQVITAANGTFASGDTTAVGSGAASLTTSFADYSYICTVPSSARQLAIRVTYAPTGTAADDWFEIEEVKLEPGGVATDFTSVALPVAIEYARRQYRKSYNIDQTPGAAVSEGAYVAKASGSLADSAVFMPVQLDGMRANPTVSIYSPTTGASGKMNGNSADISAGAINIGTSGFTIVNTATAEDGVIYSAHWVAEAKL